MKQYLFIHYNGILFCRDSDLLKFVDAGDDEFAHINVEFQWQSGKEGMYCFTYAKEKIIFQCQLSSASLLTKATTKLINLMAINSSAKINKEDKNKLYEQLIKYFDLNAIHFIDLQFVDNENQHKINNNNNTEKLKQKWREFFDIFVEFRDKTLNRLGQNKLILMTICCKQQSHPLIMHKEKLFIASGTLKDMLDGHRVTTFPRLQLQHIKMSRDYESKQICLYDTSNNEELIVMFKNSDFVQKWFGATNGQWLNKPKLFWNLLEFPDRSQINILYEKIGKKIAIFQLKNIHIDYVWDINEKKGFDDYRIAAFIHKHRQLPQNDNEPTQTISEMKEANNKILQKISSDRMAKDIMDMIPENIINIVCKEIITLRDLDKNNRVKKPNIAKFNDVLNDISYDSDYDQDPLQNTEYIQQGITNQQKKEEFLSMIKNGVDKYAKLFGIYPLYMYREPYGECKESELAECVETIKILISESQNIQNALGKALNKTAERNAQILLYDKLTAIFGRNYVFYNDHYSNFNRIGNQIILTTTNYADLVFYNVTACGTKLIFILELKNIKKEDFIVLKVWKQINRYGRTGGNVVGQRIIRISINFPSDVSEIQLETISID